MKKYFYLIILIVSLTACKKQAGTDVDNPFQDITCGDETKSGRCMPSPMVLGQVGLICNKVTQCLSDDSQESHERCTTLLENQNGLDTFIQTSAKNYSELNNLYNKKKLIVDSFRWNTCLQAIEALDCQSPTFTNSFNVNDPLNFSNIHEILRTDQSCLEVYTMKSTASGTSTLQQ